MQYLLFSLIFLWAFFTFGMKALYALIFGLFLYYLKVIFTKS